MLPDIFNVVVRTCLCLSIGWIFLVSVAIKLYVFRNVDGTWYSHPFVTTYFASPSVNKETPDVMQLCAHRSVCCTRCVWLDIAVLSRRCLHRFFHHNTLGSHRELLAILVLSKLIALVVLRLKLVDWAQPFCNRGLQSAYLHLCHSLLLHPCCHLDVSQPRSEPLFRSHACTAQPCVSCPCRHGQCRGTDLHRDLTVEEPRQYVTRFADPGLQRIHTVSLAQGCLAKRRPHGLWRVVNDRRNPRWLPDLVTTGHFVSCDLDFHSMSDFKNSRGRTSGTVVANPAPEHPVLHTSHRDRSCLCRCNLENCLPPRQLVGFKSRCPHWPISVSIREYWQWHFEICCVSHHMCQVPPHVWTAIVL